MFNNKQKLLIAEKAIAALVKEFELTPEQLMIGVHNACVHGTIFSEHAPPSDQELKELFVGLEISIDAFDKKKRHKVYIDLLRK